MSSRSSGEECKRRRVQLDRVQLDRVLYESSLAKLKSAVLLKSEFI